MPLLLPCMRKASSNVNHLLMYVVEIIIPREQHIPVSGSFIVDGSYQLLPLSIYFLSNLVLSIPTRRFVSASKVCSSGY